MQSNGFITAIVDDGLDLNNIVRTVQNDILPNPNWRSRQHSCVINRALRAMLRDHKIQTLRKIATVRSTYYEVAE